LGFSVLDTDYTDGYTEQPSSHRPTKVSQLLVLVGELYPVLYFFISLILLYFQKKYKKIKKCFEDKRGEAEHSEKHYIRFSLEASEAKLNRINRMGKKFIDWIYFRLTRFARFPAKVKYPDNVFTSFILVRIFS